MLFSIAHDLHSESQCSNLYFAHSVFFLFASNVTTRFFFQMFNNGTETDLNSSLHVSLDEIDYKQFLRKDIPATIFLTFIAITGTIGNIHTLLVYGLSPLMANITVRIFIMWLAGTDLVACLFCVPFEIFDIRYSYTFSSSGACKFFRSLNHVVTLASGGILTAIAIERFEISKNHNARVPLFLKSPKAFHIISGIILGVSILLSIPGLVFYGTTIKDIPEHPGLTGRDCTILSKYKNIRTALPYAGVVVLLSTICCIICVAIYTKILRVILNQMRKERDKQKKQIPTKAESSTDLRSQETSVSLVQISVIGNDNVSKDTKGKIKNGIQKDTPTRKESKYDKGRQLTISLIVATAVSYFGYLLYVSTFLVKLLNPKLYKNSIQPITAILLRAFFVNNAANPIVFCFIDKTFRSECLRLHRKFFKRNI